MWVYVSTAAALVAQLLVEQGLDAWIAAASAAGVVSAGARVMSLAARAGTVFAVSLAAAASLACISARETIPDDPGHVLARLDDGGRSTGALRVVADVLDPPRLRLHGSSAVVEVRGVRRADGSTEPAWGRVNLSVRHASGRVRFGERIVFQARLSRIANFGNPGEFDYARWCARRGVYVSAFVWDDRDVESLGPSPDASALTRLRVRIAEAARGARGAPGAMTAALVVGDMSALEPPVMEVIRISGLSHLLAISGMNIGLVAYVVLWMCRRVLAHTHLPASGRDPFRPAAVGAAAAVLAYASLSGGGESVVRATVMSLLALAALWQGRHGSAGRAMALAAMLLSALTPGAVAEAGFQLSFAATGAILAFAGVLGRLAALGVLFAPVVAAGIGVLCWAVTAPILAYHFQRVAVLAPAAGLATGLPSALSVVAGLVGAALLAVSETLASYAFDVASWGGAAILGTARVTAIPAWAEQVVVNPGGLLAASASALPLLPALPKPQRHRAFVILTTLIAGCALFAAYERYRDDRADVAFASVGQGDSTIVRLPGGKVLVVDAGVPGRGRMVVAPLLRRMSIRRIDYLVATHAQEDHWGGLPELAEEFVVGELWHPGGSCRHEGFTAFIERMRAAGVTVVDVGAEHERRVREAAAGPAVRRRGRPGWRIRALWPREAQGACDENDRSVVLSVSFGRSRILLTGDIERAAEHELARRPRRLRAAMLKAPHHGSRTSSSTTLLAAVRPAAALASSGAANRYGFPAREVVSRYEALGIALYRTDVDGALRVEAYRDRLILAPTRGTRRAVAAPHDARPSTARLARRPVD